MKNKKLKSFEVEYFTGTARTTRQFQNTKKCPTSKIGLTIVILLTILAICLIKNASKGINYQLNNENALQVANLKEFGGIVSAYNLIEAQTDGSPCISAYNIDVCQLLEQGVPVVANNCLEKGTEIEIEDLGRFVVLDKMNSRYSCEYFDIAMPRDKVIEAIKFGTKERRITIYE